LTPVGAAGFNGAVSRRKVMREAERELEAATGRTTLNSAVRKLMRAKAELKRLAAENPA
jgi:hypothetical protein